MDIEERQMECDFDDLDADEHYVRCLVCDELVDLTDTHPVIIARETDDLGEPISRVYHFSSGECRATWKRERGYGVDD
ncbi:MULTISPECIES: DUF7576 family protein [Halorussus]|uniref:DUF7576 family protein n=1 Tax=Halorussus TaxID=1070314 RepID=UPI00209DAB5A|nr:hypothetical protein [Halorussus vallis]USZ74931.1 hypothetical protein NGM07_16010 [Halorussus vallis]